MLRARDTVRQIVANVLIQHAIDEAKRAVWLQLRQRRAQQQRERT